MQLLGNMTMLVQSWLLSLAGEKGNVRAAWGVGTAVSHHSACGKARDQAWKGTKGGQGLMIIGKINDAGANINYAGGCWCCSLYAALLTTSFAMRCPSLKRMLLLT